ncbi:MAG TPA: ATP-binding protein [Oscillospiraceae bacterium]|nr:ATP-binding protein [Oscillospiraceae bacterium]HRW57912.1 ATP-binding protein [Oscillospiraceae bacterium]
MTKRIFRSIFLVASLVLLASFLIIMGVLYEYFTNMQKDELKVQAALAVHGVENDGRSYFDGLDTEGYRLTWVAADGTVLYDTEADAATMENHAEREEIKEALETGTGESERASTTLAEKTRYYAKLLTDGTVLRVSVRQYTVFALMLGMLRPICIVLGVALILSAVLANRLSKQIVEPLNTLNLDNPLENNAYEELSPLLTRVEHQHRQIGSQLDELKRKQDEFTAVTDSMSEGLILMNEKGVVLSINRSAMRLFRADPSCVGHDILTVDRSLPMQRLLSDAQNRRHGEAIMELGGGTYQVNSSPVLSDDRIAGVCILAFDITEKARAEKQRREFSANVSHELKTPLHSIMGSAELLEAGLVEQEDIPRFVGHIRSEAARLVDLVNDIIRLSQLDENEELPREDVEMRPLAEEAAAALANEAESKEVTVEIHGDPADVNGVRRLLYEIIYNLCDNAIKYNVPGGHVDVDISKNNGEITLSVSDTGIGIPPEAQNRVFERFYRVDQGRSKETGGTGLGLSIVKHAAQYHNAKIEMESEVGKGTRIRIRFPEAEEKSLPENTPEPES